MLLVEDVVDTGLTLNFLCRTLALRNPASLQSIGPISATSGRTYNVPVTLMRSF